MKWSELSPQQRNALVHEKVMGLPLTGPCTAKLYWYPDPYTGLHRGRWLCSYGHTGTDGDGSHAAGVPIARYSESMDAAMFVVRKMNKSEDGTCERYDTFVNALTSIIGSTLFFDLFYCDEDPSQDHLTPERLCLAALRAVDVEIEP